MAIGNGWTAPSYQYAYQDFAYANKLIDSETYRHLNTTYKYCRDLINDGHYLLANTICQSIFSDILRLNPGLNYYDIKLPCVGSLCFDFSKVEAFLNDPANQKTLGVNVQFTECADSINAKWSISDRIKNYEPNVKTVLDAGHRVLFYNGDDDLICNVIFFVFLNYLVDRYPTSPCWYFWPSSISQYLDQHQISWWCFSCWMVQL